MSALGGCRAASASVSRSRAQSRGSRRCCCSTSRCPHSMLIRGTLCAVSCATCSPHSTFPRSSSPTTSRMPPRSPTGSACSSKGGCSRSVRPARARRGACGPVRRPLHRRDAAARRRRARRSGLTRVALDVGGVAWTTDAGVGRVAVAVHPWEVAVSRRDARGLDAEPHLGADCLARRDRKPGARTGWAAGGRDHERLGRAPGAPRGRRRRRVVQGTAARLIPLA